MSDHANKLADEHWSYVAEVIKTEWEAFATVKDVDASNIEDHLKIIGMHYKSAMIHGFKHGVDWQKDQTILPKGTFIPLT